MKRKLTNSTKRKFFQMEASEEFRQKLSDLASLDGISASDVIRVLVTREHLARVIVKKVDDPPCPEEEK